MTVAIIITLCTLLLVAYLFDLSSKYTRIPSVILLLALGWIVSQTVNSLGIHVVNLFEVLPILGTIGLILIVLEGSLELELNKSKKTMIGKSLVAALLPMFIISFIIAYMFHMIGGAGFKTCLVNAVPLAVISSAIAIPSVRNLSAYNKEFVIYESSLSDILGVLFFNFVALNETISGGSFAGFGLELLMMVVVSFIATVLLSFLMNNITHHIKFAPIILLVILIYEVSKVFHLPGLIFILVFGLFIGNLDELKRFKWIEKFKPEKLDAEVGKFKEIVGEAAFLIRALFFLLFGFLIDTRDILNLETLGWSFVISSLIFLLRALFLMMLKLPVVPLLFIAPRGLITILLFLSIPLTQQIPLANNSLIIQVILMTALFMMIGLIMTSRKEKINSIPEIKDFEEASTSEH
jgi:cell volume regulation protein A